MTGVVELFERKKVICRIIGLSAKMSSVSFGYVETCFDTFIFVLKFLLILVISFRMEG